MEVKPMPKRTVVCDIETDGLLSNVTKIWCIVCKDWDTGEIFTFDPTQLNEFDDFAPTVHHWIGHNFIAFDLRVLKKIRGVKIKPTRVTDTLLVSRLQQYTREGGHSLKAWGKTLGFPKVDHEDWTQYSPEMMQRCITDVELTYKVAKYLKSEGGRLGSKQASQIEHLSQHHLENQSELGFALDAPKAHRLFAMFKDKAQTLKTMIKNAVHDRPYEIGKITPRYKKTGELSKVGLKFLGDEYTDVSGVFTRIGYEEFNLDSTKQKVLRLMPYWKPTMRTKGYRKLIQRKHDKGMSDEEFDRRAYTMWQLSDENLATISDKAPTEFKSLAEYAMLTSRANEVEGWLDALGSDDRVHGRCFSIGAITHRMSHSQPNMANIPGGHSPYGQECRSCFTVGQPDAYVLLGCDASGIQLRILAHYMNDKDYTYEVVNGDIHHKNLDAMGIDKGEWNDERGQWGQREVAKTFIYAWLLGAGDEKVGSIIGGSSRDGRRVRETFLASLPALKRLKSDATKAARLGRMAGLDGRQIQIKSAHFALSCYLQGAESVIMKYAMLLWHGWVAKHGYDARQVAVVHDEFQVEVAKEHAEEVGELVKKSIIMAGQHFNLKCPLDAEYTMGLTWADTH
jgi:DNA polymerase-1